MCVAPKLQFQLQHSSIKESTALLEKLHKSVHQDRQTICLKRWKRSKQCWLGSSQIQEHNLVAWIKAVPSSKQASEDYYSTVQD